MTVHYLTVDEVLIIHADQIECYGGSSGLCDSGQLQSALHRPQSGYYADVIAEAAALWESLSQNHPFVDGNKRTAVASTITFLGMNGIELIAEWDVTAEFVLGLYERGGLNFSNLEAWLRANTRASRA